MHYFVRFLGKKIEFEVDCSRSHLKKLIHTMEQFYTRFTRITIFVKKNGTCRRYETRNMYCGVYSGGDITNHEISTVNTMFLIILL
jgi:hypothetical protein